MTDLKSLSLTELTNYLKELGEPAFRAKQLYRWMHVSLAESYEEMTNLPKSLKEKLKENASYVSLKKVNEQTSAIDGTKKFLFELPDGNLVETVLMRYKFGNSVCVSSQVGCKMGCRFCASTLNGWERNLSPSEILEQVYSCSRVIGEKISHVVVMGTGEPLDNYDNLVRFLRLLTGEDGQNLSMRNVTVSTCGIVPRIYDFANEGLSCTLALSLHAATDAQRKETMPIAERYSIPELMEAVRYYFEKTGRQVTFEYALISGVNDSTKDAENLASLAGPLRAHINLIPVNPVKERNYVRSGKAEILSFKNSLEKQGISVTIRRELGRDIDGACGQLRRRHILNLEST